MLPGEDQSPAQCEDCQKDLPLQVLRSYAGYYIGTMCDCDPYSRASDYFPTRKIAEFELEVWNIDEIRPHGRTPGYLGS